MGNKAYTGVGVVGLIFVALGVILGGVGTARPLLGGKRG